MWSRTTSLAWSASRRTRLFSVVARILAMAGKIWPWVTRMMLAAVESNSLPLLDSAVATNCCCWGVAWFGSVMSDLNSLLPAASGWTLTTATGINAGDQIVGSGTIGGATHAFLMTPLPTWAIDGNGTRLGRGKGHYDRALIRLKKSGARLVGVGWPLQRLDETIPADEWDVPLDAFASPEGLEIFGR